MYAIRKRFYEIYLDLLGCHISHPVNYVVHLITGSVPQVKCQELSSHMLNDSSKKNKKPWLSVERTVDPETRYMDLCAVVLQCQDPDKTERVVLLAAGCSDGFLR